MMDKDEQRMLKVVGIRRSWLYGGEFKKFFSFSDVRDMYIFFKFKIIMNWRLLLVGVKF